MPRHIINATITLALVALLGTCGPTGDKNRQDATLAADCDPYDFDCGDGEQCVGTDVVCDGTEDCNNGADEADCGCGVGWMTCDNGDCVHAAFICDGVYNCTDHSDEDNCPGP
jgi:hypothetical protein